MEKFFFSCVSMWDLYRSIRTDQPSGALHNIYWCLRSQDEVVVVALLEVVEVSVLEEAVVEVLVVVVVTILDPRNMLKVII